MQEKDKKSIITWASRPARPDITLDDTTAERYYQCMILNFACKQTEKLYRGRFAKKLPSDLQRSAQRKLSQLNAATTLDFLRIPPGNRLEQLSGNRTGQWSIRINSQWRICFRWLDGNVQDVEIVDYH